MKKRLAGILKILTVSERRKFISLIFLNTFLSIADILSIALVFIVLDIYTNNIHAWLSPFLQQLHLSRQSLLPAMILIMVFVIKSAAGYFIIKKQSRYISDTATRITSRNLLLYLEGRYEDHVSIDSSVWIRRICFQPMEFAQYVVAGLQQIINEFMLVIVTIIALALYNFKLLIIVSLVLLPAIFFLVYISKRRLKNIRQNIKTANEKSIQYLSEAINGFVESNIYGKNRFFIQRYTNSQFIQNRFIADMQLAQAIPNRFFETFAVIGLFIFITIIQTGGSGSYSNILMLGAFIAAAYKIIPGISKIINFLSQVKTYFFTVEELSQQHPVTSIINSNIMQENIDAIEMKNIHFAYANNVVLKDVSISVSKNSLTGICGKSGKGKTTLIDLILGFLQPSSGDIIVNNQSMGVTDLKRLWPQIAYVKQAVFLVHDSILNNITLFNETVDQQKLNTILECTGLNEWIKTLPGGVQTIITENGKNISGGQRQRIAVARALYKDAPLIILDEPFNELDEQSELRLLHYLKKLAANGKTILLVTHNMGSFSFCDNVIYLDETKS